MVRGSGRVQPTGEGGQAPTGGRRRCHDAPTDRPGVAVRWVPEGPLVRRFEARYPGSVMGAPGARTDHADMDSISPRRTMERPPVGPLIAGTIVSTLLIVSGVV